MDIESFLDRKAKEKTHKTRNQKRQQRRKYYEKNDVKMEFTLDLGPKTIKELQATDATLEGLQKQDTKLNEAETGTQIISKDGILYRQVQKPGMYEPIEQLIVPKQCRTEVVKIAHDIPLSGHLGKKKPSTEYNSISTGRR